ncbi:hypothetical protein ACHQM5_001764 [Ranunculus cassubicifolius]
MEDYRSKSYGDRNMQIQSYNGGGGSQSSRASYGYGPHQDHRSYSASYASSMPPTDPKLKKVKSSGSSSKIWNFNDPELQRKKRVASYKVYSVEGKLKGSFRKNWRWLKDRYSQVVYGWW